MVPTPTDITEQLSAASGGDADLARELATVMVTEMARLLAEARAAALAGHAARFQQAAHTLTGCAGTLGFGPVADMARSLEMLAGEGRLAAAVDIESLASACDEADRALRWYLQPAAKRA